MSEPTYARIKAKCLNCSLHFVLCSQRPECHNQMSLYCPECGQHEGQFMVWIERVAGVIAQEVPGTSRQHTV